jgi:hypothetical protein
MRAYLNVNEKTVYRLAKRGDLLEFKVAGAWRLKRSASYAAVFGQMGSRMKNRNHRSRRGGAHAWLQKCRQYQRSETAPTACWI